MDIRLTGLDIEAISEDAQPPELREYSENLRELYVDRSLLGRRSIDSHL